MFKKTWKATTIDLSCGGGPSGVRRGRKDKIKSVKSSLDKPKERLCV
jgi:hypothetical protein